MLGAVSASCENEPPAWQVEDGYSWKELRAAGNGLAGFQELRASKTGIGISNTVSVLDIVRNRHVMHGSGLAIGDVDGDDLADIYVATLFGPNALYLNRGNFRFTSVPHGPSLDAYRSTGVLMADTDGDHDLDVIVSMLEGPNTVLINDGTGQFDRQQDSFDIAAAGGSTTMTLADIDGDRDLDLYLGRYKRLSITDSLPPDELAWENVVDNETHRVRSAFADHYTTKVFGTKVMRVELGESDALYVNDGLGRFTAVPWTTGAFLDEAGTPIKEIPRDWALTARFYDVNQDGHPDLYVCNDYESPDYLWMGQGDGVFRMASPEVLRKTSNATMSVDFADVDRDGAVDIFTTDMLSRLHSNRLRQRNTRIPIPVEVGDLNAQPQEMQNTLLMNRGDATFQELAHYANVAASDWSWSTSFVDIDLDGFEDILVTTGHVFDVQDEDALELELRQQRHVSSFEEYRGLLLGFPPLLLANHAFRNLGDRTFAAVEDGWGIGTEPDVAHGMALGDLDADGDLDAVINRLNQPVAVYKNEVSNPRIAIRLDGAGANTFGIGARVRVLCPGLPPQEREMTSGGQYLSSSEALLVFAGPRTKNTPCRLVTTWMDGAETIINNAVAGRLYAVSEAAATPADAGLSGAPRGDVFRMEKIWPEVRHHESSNDDYEQQPLLPWSISQRGPAAVMADLTGNELVDVIIGSGRGGTLSVLYQKAQGFSPLTDLSETLVAGDVAGIVAAPWSAGEVQVFAGISNEESSAEESYITVLSVCGSRVSVVGMLPFGEGAIGPLTLLDVDQDGDLDLFAAGYAVAGNYPKAGTSRLYRNNDGLLSAGDALALAYPGLVTGAAAGDLDNDGDTDLVLATEWGPLRVLLNENKNFVDHTERLGLNDLSGWWKGVALGDFDEDGRLDIVATNWGWNSSYGRPGRRPLRLYYGDIDQSGTVDLVQTRYAPAMTGFVPTMGLRELSTHIPGLRRRWASHAAFAQATVDRILPPRMPFLETSTLASTVLLNSGSTFEPIPLPDAAQWSAAFGVAVADFDADGHEDLVLSQNHYSVRSTMVRQDAGRGILLRGAGDGTFTAVLHSGLAAYGDGRSVAAGDFDQNGRVDILVAQNGAEVELYRNDSAVEGLRVRLHGRQGNAWGIGAILRAQYADGSWGPARVVSAGTGYWAQHAPIQVLGRSSEVVAVAVRWPSGVQTLASVSRGKTQISISETP